MATLQYKFTSDILFKMLFTRNEELLRSLVAAALGIAPADIKTLNVKNPEILPEEPGSKFCRLDLNMVVNDELVDLEIQVADEGNFKERALYYWSKIFAASLDEGKDYLLVPRTVLISILDFDLFSCEGMLSEFAILEKTRYELLTDKFELDFYELRKLPDIIDKSDMMQVWLKLIGARTEEDVLAVERLEVREMAQAVSAYRQITGSQEYQELERMRDKARHDEAQALGNARRQERDATLKETAKRLLTLGIPADTISIATELSCEEIENLK